MTQSSRLSSTRPTTRRERVVRDKNLKNKDDIFLDENVFQGILKLMPGTLLDMITVDLKSILISPGNKLIIEYEGKNTHKGPSEKEGPGQPIETDPRWFHGCPLVSFNK